MKLAFVLTIFIFILFCCTALASPVEITIDYGNCTESWSCGSWSNCTSNIQTRTCTDSNNCGTTVNKPAVSQSCTANCTENWSCPDWSTISCVNSVQTRTCTDSNNCGTTVNKSAETQSCSSGNPSSPGGGGTSPSSSPPVKPSNKTVSTEPKIEIPPTPALKQSDVVSLSLSCVDEIESGDPLSVKVTISSKNAISTTVELLKESQDVSLLANETKTLDFEVYAPETEGAYNLVAVTPYATGNKTINLIFKPLFLYVNPLENNTYEIHLKNFDNKSSTELEVIKDNSETVYLDDMEVKIDYRVNLTFSKSGNYIVKATANEASGLVDEDERLVKIPGNPGIDYGYIILGAVVIVILIASVILFRGKKVI